MASSDRSVPDAGQAGARQRRFVGSRNEEAYFTAENRLSNELADTTGAAPESCVLAAAAGVASDSDGLNGGRVAASLVSAGFGSVGLAVATALDVSLGASFGRYMLTQVVIS